MPRPPAKKLKRASPALPQPSSSIQALDFMFDDDGDSSQRDSPDKKGSKGKGKAKEAQTPEGLISASVSSREEEEEPSVAPASSAKTKTAPMSTASAFFYSRAPDPSSKPKKPRQVVDLSSDEASDSGLNQMRARQKGKHRQTGSAAASASPVSRTSPKRPQPKTIIVDSSGEEEQKPAAAEQTSESDAPKSANKRQKKRPVTRPESDPEDLPQEPSELSEDEDDLEMDFDTLTESRLRTKRAKPDRLATLKAQREAKQARQEARERDSHRRSAKPVIVDSDEEEKRAEQKKKERKKEKKAERKRQQEAAKLRREVMELDHDGNDNDQEDQGDADGQGGSEDERSIDSDDAFVVQDGDEDAEVWRRQMPAHLSATAFQPPKWHHRQFVVLLVRRALLLEDERTEDLRVSREKCRKMVNDLIHSLIRSQAWNKRFTDALTLPNLSEHSVDEVIEGCDACSLGGRKSKTILTLSGKTYVNEPPYRPKAVHKRTGEPEDTDDDSTKAYKQREFAVGSECKRRATVYHHLQHFEWSMWRQVTQMVATVKQEEDSSDEEINRKEWERRQFELLDEVVDRLEKKNFFKCEWRMLKQLMDEAKNAYAH